MTNSYIADVVLEERLEDGVEPVILAVPDAQAHLMDLSLTTHHICKH